MSEKSALQRYNRLFDNQKYTTIAGHIASDLHVSRDSVRVSDGMNLITNTALSLVGYPHYTDAWLKLAIFCGQNAISITTVDAIHEYLLIYQQLGDTRPDDFELTAKCLLKSYESMDSLKAAVSCANGVHGWHGRMAYHLLAASDYLAQAAVQLLRHGNLSYIREKLHLGLKRIVDALHEGMSYSERPEYFDCHEIDFPPVKR